MAFTPRTVYGVDFSGAKLAGRTLWIARAEKDKGRLRLVSLDNLERLAGTAERGPCMACLVSMIRASDRALWAIDAPFSMPVELLPPRAGYPFVLTSVRKWEQGAHALGHHYLALAKQRGGANHLRRLTDAECRAPFSCYHYRIAYQTMYVQRDVLYPLLADANTCVLPFQAARLRESKRVLVEACPSSTLKLLGQPHHNYKQPQGGPLTSKRRRTRRQIVERLKELVELEPSHVLRIMRDGGGDALDAVLAAFGGHWSWGTLDHAAIGADPRRKREGFIYAGPSGPFVRRGGSAG